MKYVLMLHVPTREPYKLMSWPQEDLQAHLAFLNSFNEKLRKSGELVEIQALTGPDQARLVRAGNEGKPITDGVFPEAKEFLAGFWMVDVESPERAYELAAQASAAPGLGGEPLNMAIEVRQVMSASEVPEERP
ncbi:YciI family protein [Sorangium sp. So ce291]|uniref:YciI family protein n=1 Tax=Sorangium sp. So ce291 TaxID=3133294 RepID=UPI003F63F2CF